MWDVLIRKTCLFVGPIKNNLVYGGRGKHQLQTIVILKQITIRTTYYVIKSEKVGLLNIDRSTVNLMKINLAVQKLVDLMVLVENIFLIKVFLAD